MGEISNAIKMEFVASSNADFKLVGTSSGDNLATDGETPEVEAMTDD